MTTFAPEMAQRIELWSTSRPVPYARAHSDEHALRCPKELIRFTREQGADQHCEANAPGYRDYCIYNWLAERLA